MNQIAMMGYTFALSALLLGACSEPAEELPVGRLPPSSALGLYYADEDASDGPGLPSQWSVGDAPDPDGDFRAHVHALDIRANGSFLECDSLATYVNFTRTNSYPVECVEGTWREAGAGIILFEADSCLQGDQYLIHDVACSDIDPPNTSAESLLGVLNFCDAPQAVLEQDEDGGPIVAVLSAASGNCAGKNPREYTQLP